VTPDQPTTEPLSQVEAAPQKQVRYRGFYALPSLFTLSSLFAAFYAITAAFNNKFEVAAMAMFVSMVLDGLDGRVARLTHTQSEFGAQLDSIVDMVAFGVAPALVVYLWSLSELGKVGWIIAFIYAACASLRLARFNTQIGVVDKKYFIGLASPSAAALVAGTVWVFTDLEVSGKNEYVPYIAALITASAAFLMVSNFKYSSFKDLNARNRIPLLGVLVMAVLLAIFSSYPSKMLLGLASAYAVSGPLHVLLKWRKKQSI
jgi:CDP-diacylglycerol--serine O-phosphatidyltransferase